MTIREPLWWIWLSSFLSLYFGGNPYYCLPRFELRESAWISTQVRAACKNLRKT